MKRTLKIATWIVLTPIILLLLVGALLYVPPVQDWAVNRVASMATKGTGLHVSVSRVGLSFPLDLDVRGIVATDDQGDTLLDVRRAVLDLDFSHIFDGRLGIDEISLHDGFANTKSIMQGLSVRGRIGLFAVCAPQGIDLDKQHLTVDGISLNNCDLDVFVGEMEEDTDTTATVLPTWMVKVGRMAVENVHVKCSIQDSMSVETKVAQIEARDFGLDAETLNINLALLSAATDYIILDSLAIPGINAYAHSVAYDSTRIVVDSLRVGLSQTWLTARADVEWGSIDTERPDGVFDVCASFTMGNADLDSLCRRFGLPLMAYNRKASVAANLCAIGNMNQVRIDDTHITIDKIVDLTTTADIHHPLDSLLRATLDADMKTLAGRASLRADYDNATQAYSALADIAGLNPRMFSRQIPVRLLSAKASVNGRGTDLESAATRLNAHASLTRCLMDSLELGGATLDAALANRSADIRLDYSNDIADASAQFNVIRRERIRQIVKGDEVKSIRMNPYEGTFGLDLRRLDMHALGLVDSALSVAACMHVDMVTNLKTRHRISGTVNDIALIRPDTVLRPVDLRLDVMVRPDSLYTFFSAGAMRIKAGTRGGIDDVMKQADTFMAELENQANRHFIDQNVMRPLLPTADIDMQICGRNPVSTWLAVMGYTFNDMTFKLTSNPETGLNGGGHVWALNTGAMLLDTIRWHIFQDSVGVKMDAQVKNGPKNKQFVFDARLNSYILGDGAGFNLTYTDGHKRKGVDIGAVAQLKSNGVVMSLTPLRPIVAYRNFQINKGNYFFLANNGEILANFDMLADDGTGLQVYSQRHLEDVQDCDSCLATVPSQDLTVSFRHFNLGELSSVLPYMPRLGGLLEGDAHYMQQDSVMSVALDTRIKKFSYEGSPVGDIGLNAAYLPGEAGEHFVDGMMTVGGKECGNFNGTYADDGQDGIINVEASLTQFPMSIINGFVEKGLAQASGSVDGQITVVGSPTAPVVNGALETRGINIRSTDYSLLLRVEDDRVGIVNNYLDLDKLRVFSSGRNPIVVDGWVDFRDLAAINLDLTMKGSNFELINAKKSYQATAYGKVYCDVDARMRGNLEAITLTGRLNVLGNTDVTYVLRDSPLTVEDRLKDLVTFVDFNNDDEPTGEEELSKMDITMNMRVSVDDAARVHCLLSEDKSSYVDIEGGGELVMTYSPQGEIQLNGRYTVNSGEMKYQLPVIPLKTFNIESGSYVAFTGKMLNPTLNISAKERMKAVVGDESGRGRSVAFDVGVKITQTLENMGLQFTIDAPEDAAVQSDLATMDETARGRIAVTMLATGMYLSDNNSSGFTTENALNSFLQSEISNLAGKALGSVDLQFGMENNTSATGTTQTDYSFRFAKHFWGNRVSVVLGGTVSSGSEAENTGATLIDNVSIEYRLDDGATRYVRVFYDKAYESLIDGKITEMGAGLVLRRKTTKLGELFVFRKKKG